MRSGRRQVGTLRLKADDRLEMPEQKPGAITPENSVIIRRVSRQLARIANERDMTLGELAETIGLSYAFVRNLMDGKQNLTILTLEEICGRLGVPIEIMLAAYLHPEPEPATLKTRWGAKRAAKQQAVAEGAINGGAQDAPGKLGKAPKVH